MTDPRLRPTHRNHSMRPYRSALFGMACTCAMYGPAACLCCAGWRGLFRRLAARRAAWAQR